MNLGVTENRESAVASFNIFIRKAASHRRMFGVSKSHGTGQIIGAATDTPLGLRRSSHASFRYAPLTRAQEHELEDIILDALEHIRSNVEPRLTHATIVALENTSIGPGDTHDHASG
ncbi:hypothetical protein [Caballeronia glebae]|uniref:hypothetical protein n=1 Tax=Caballeronia glebae TaxID=1777143 RepID=UPI00117FB658|nr:hypothetical protein [Caballeronia glebae]